jgi:RNA polymerase sigma-70 factor (ECF subfamily)
MSIAMERRRSGLTFNDWGTRDHQTSIANGQEVQSPDEVVTDEVIAACRVGDADAFQRMYDVHVQRVFRLAARMVGVNDASDVTQLVFLNVFRSIRNFKGESRFDTWLYRLTVNESLQHLRRNRRWRCRELDWEPMERSRQLEAPEQREILDRALAKVDPDLRAIFLLREVEQLAYREIAAVLEMSEGTVASRLNRARRELQAALLDLGWQP